MKAVPVVVNSLFLCGVNFFFIVAGFVAYSVLHPASQLALQLPIAVVGSVLGFVFFDHHCRAKNSLHLRNAQEQLAAYSAAFLWFPLVFVPIHYFTQGYLTALSNVYAVWIFQALTNGVALLLVQSNKRGRLNRDGTEVAAPR